MEDRRNYKLPSPKHIMSIETYVGEIRSALETAEEIARYVGISLKIEYQEGTIESDFQSELYQETNEAERALILSQMRRMELPPHERQMALEILLRVADSVREDSDLHKNSLDRIKDLAKASFSKQVA